MSETKRITVGQLKDQMGAAYPRPFLFCSECGGEYTANRGDYFAADPSTVLKCCDQPMALVVRKTKLVRVAA